MIRIFQFMPKKQILKAIAQSLGIRSCQHKQAIRQKMFLDTSEKTSRIDEMFQKFSRHYNIKRHIKVKIGRIGTNRGISLALEPGDILHIVIQSGDACGAFVQNFVQPDAVPSIA